MDAVIAGIVVVIGGAVVIWYFSARPIHSPGSEAEVIEIVIDETTHDLIVDADGNMEYKQKP